MTEKKQSSGLMYIFGIPRFGSALFLGIVGLGLQALYFDGFGLDPFWVGSVQSIGYVTIAFSQFFFGWISDRSYTRWGRRKPWIYLLTPIEVVAFICLLMPQLFLTNPSNETLLRWLLIWNITFEFSYAGSTPYGAWMAESFNEEQRPKLSQIMNTFSFLGNGVMSVFSLIVLTGAITQLKTNPAYLPTVYIWAIIGFGLIYFVGFYLTAILMPVEPPPKIPPNLTQNLKDIMHHRNFWMVSLMQGIASLAWITVTSVMLVYTSKVLGFSSTEYIIAGVVLLLGIVFFLYIWRRIIVKYGKKKGLLAVFIVAAITLSTSLIGLIPMTSTTVFGILFIVGIAASLGGWGIVSVIWYADLAEDDTRRSEQMKAGLYVGFPSIPLNLFQALGTLILGAILKLSDITVGTRTFTLGLVLWGPFCSIVLLIAFFYSRKYITLDFLREKK